MEDLPKLTNQLEFLFLKRIIEGFRERTIDFPTAQDLAKKFLEMEPFASFEDAKQKDWQLCTNAGAVRSLSRIY